MTSSVTGDTAGTRIVFDTQMPNDALLHVIGYAPDTALVLRATSRALHRLVEECLHSNGEEIAARCSSVDTPLYRQVYLHYVNFNLRRSIQPHCLGAAFHLVVSNTIRSMGIALDFPDRILLSEELGHFNERVQTIQDLNVQRIWVRVIQTVFRNNPLPLEVPEMSAQQMRSWMQAQHPALQNIGRLDLDHLQLTSAPVEIGGWTGLQMLSLEGNQLVSLPEGLFRGLNQLQRLNLGYNQLATIPPALFHGLTQLRHIDLRHNRCVTLHEGLLEGLVQLQWLSLDNNQFRFLPEGLFQGLIGLRSLFLYSNELDSLPAGLLQGLTHLQGLYLNYNRLASLPEDLFRGLVQLKELHLSNNQLVSLPEDLFRGLVQLKSLEIYPNAHLLVSYADFPEYGIGNNTVFF